MGFNSGRDDATKLNVTNTGTTTDSMKIIADALTTGTMFSASADSLVSGSMIHLESTSANTAPRSLMKIENANAAATGCTLLELMNKAPQSGAGYDDADVAALTTTLYVGTSANESNPLVMLENTRNDAKGPLLSFFNSRNDGDSANSADDSLGIIDFNGIDGGDNDVVAAKLETIFPKVEDSAGEGSLVITTLLSGTATEVARTNPESTTTDAFMGGLGFRIPIGGDPQGQTLAVSQAGAAFAISTNGATVTLPPTVQGVSYTFIWTGTAGHTYKISPNTNDRIMGSILDVANGNIVTAASNGFGADNKDLELDSGSKFGDRVTLVGDGTHGWFILDALGSWKFES